MTNLTIERAERIAKKAQKSAREDHRNPMGIVVIDNSGNIKFALREDGCNLAAIDIALGKARAALTFNCTSKQIADALSGNTLAGPSILSALDGRIVLLGGGVPIRNGDETIIGAIGAAGGAPDDDEAVALAGTTA